MAPSQTDQARDELLQARIELRIAELRLLAAWTVLRFERLRESEHGRPVRNGTVGTASKPSAARASPLQFCLERGIVEPATVVDHIEPHRGDLNKFALGRLQSLCKPCHDGAKRQIEQRGYRSDIGLDGWPLDPKHPVYQRNRR